MNEISLLEGLLQHYSPTGCEADAVRYLVAQMGASGYHASIDEVGNAVGVIGDGPREIVLLGHIDTTPGRIDVRRDADVLWGRGAVDAKGPLACFVAACARAGVLPGRRLIVIGAVGEEGDSRGAKYVRDRYRPDALIIGEPSGWDRVTLGYKGSAWFYYTAQRTLAHTAAEHESACEAAIGFWNRVTDYASTYNTDRTRMFDQLRPTLRAMRSDSDGFVETAALKLGLRLPPDVCVAEVAARVHELAIDAHVELIDGVAAYRAEKNTALARSFLAAIRAVGGEPRFTLKSGTSDMNLVAPVWNCPTLAYGPGDSSLDHTPDERICISEYLRGIDVLAGALNRFH
jgi:LysW-gamma-L-lysine carboxypeptidase